MSYIFNNQIEYSDSPNLDAFGRLRVSTTFNVLDIKHTYNKAPLIVNEYTAGTATSTLDLTNARVTMTTSANNDYVVRVSKTSPLYQPGKSQLFEATFSNFNLETNVIKRVGGFTSATGTPFNTVFDGYFLESNGVTNKISFQVWKSGTTIYSADTTTWDSSQINPSSIDWSKSQLMLTDFQWLGVGRIRFGMVFSGLTYYFTEYTATNNGNTVYMSSPNQPIRYEIRQSGVGSGTFNQICSAVSTEGPLNLGLYGIESIPYTATTTMSTSGVKYPYIGIRLKKGYEKVNSDIKKISILNTSNDNYLVTLEFNPTLSSTPTWVTLSDPSPFQYALGNGTPTITSEGFILSSFLGEAGTTAISDLDVEDNVVQPGAGLDGTFDELWVCITPLGANATFIGTINTRYYL